VLGCLLEEEIWTGKRENRVGVRDGSGSREREGGEEKDGTHTHSISD
jgi:hypothetical protein